jgi:hypothetical protein
MSMEMITWQLCKWFLDLRSLSYLICRMLYFNPITCYLNPGNKVEKIEYNMTYIKILEWTREDSSP